MYFPVEGALVKVEYNDTLQVIEANHLGELPLDLGLEGEDVDIDSDLKALNTYPILGRKKTSSVTGGHGNVIKDGIIYLSSPAYPTHRIPGTNAFVYDFGVKIELGHGHGHDDALTLTHAHARTPSSPSSHVARYPLLRRDNETLTEGEGEGETNGTKVSCMSNHGGPNCSNKFGIFNGRCAFVGTTVCIKFPISHSSFLIFDRSVRFLCFVVIWFADLNVRRCSVWITMVIGLIARREGVG